MSECKWDEASAYWNISERTWDDTICGSNSECVWNGTTFDWDTSPYTWDTTDCSNPLGCVWNTNPYNWDTMEHLWNSADICVATPVTPPSSGGGVDLTQPELYDPHDPYAKAKKKLDKKCKKKLVKVIIYLNNRRFVDEKEVCDIDNYKITVKDINILLEEYNKYKKQILISIDDVTWN